MAWTWKMTAVTAEVPGTDEQGNPITIDISKQGRFQATVDVFSDTAATVLVDERNYEFPHEIDTNAAVALINEDIARMRDARARVVTLTPLIGQKVTVP